MTGFGAVVFRVKFILIYTLTFSGSFLVGLRKNVFFVI